jgi:hypothetical protein
LLNSPSISLPTCGDRTFGQFPPESNILKRKRQDLNILNSASETIKSINSLKNKGYLSSQLEKIKIFFLFWKNWLFYCFM